jgi:hypothetical protein
MDKGYVILLLLILAHGTTAALLYVRAKRSGSVPREEKGDPESL